MIRRNSIAMCAVYSQPCFSANAFVASTLSNDDPASPTYDRGSPVDIHPINGFSHPKDAIKQMLGYSYYFLRTRDFKGASWSHYYSAEVHFGAPYWIWLLPSDTCFFTSLSSLIVDLIFAMQYNISLSLCRIPGHLIFRLHFNTSGTIPVKVCFWQVILRSNWLLFAMQTGDRVSICIDQSVDFLSFLEAHLFVGSRKIGLHFLILSGSWVSLHEKSCGLNWHGSIIFLMIWDLRQSSPFRFIPIANTKHVELDCHLVWQQFLAGLISLSYVLASSQVSDLLTKTLSGPSHHTVLGKLGISPCPSNLRGWGGVGWGEGENGMLDSSVSVSASLVRKVKTTTSPREIQIGETTCVRTKYPLFPQCFHV